MPTTELVDPAGALISLRWLADDPVTAWFMRNDDRRPRYAARFFAWQLHQDGRAAMRNAMLAIVALGLLSLAEPFWFWRLLGAG